MVQADYLFLMTDVDGLYTKNPRNHVDAEVIEVVDDISTISADVSSAGSSLGTGGMSTKLVAARLATSAGVTTVITRSSKPGNVSEIVSYVQALKAVTSDPSYVPGTPLSEQGSSLSAIIESLPIPPRHTRFLPDPYPIRDRRFWLLHGLAPYGTIYIDEGAHRALMDKAGLLPVGVVDVEGHFAQQEAVRIVVVKRLPSKPLVNGSPNPDAGIDPEGTGTSRHPLYEKTSPKPIEVGRALVNYSATEIARIKGLRSSDIEGVLGYADSEYVALRENVSLVRKRSGTGSGNITPTRGDSSSSSRVNLVSAPGEAA
jgi:glutamate 5-kinase